MEFRWYNPLSWRMFGYNDPVSGNYVELSVGGKGTNAGVTITPDNAITIPMVWSCIKILSETVSGLPLKLYEDVGGERSLVSKEKPADRRQLRLLSKPNPVITRLNFLKAMVVNMALCGNGFAMIQRDSSGEWIGTIPVSVESVDVDQSDEGIGLIYYVNIHGARIPVSPENMLHFKLFSKDGIIGMSPVEAMAETMGSAKAAQDWSSRFMRKGGFTGGYVVYKDFLTKEQQTQIMAKFPDVRAGDTESIGKMGILQGGPTIIPAGLSQKDSQFIESRQFSEEELAGIWGVPLFLANRASKTSIMGSNLEQQVGGFVKFGVKPYLDAIEDEFNEKIFGGTNRFVEFVVEGILRGDSAARASYYQSALGGSGGSGWMSIDEVREKENLPPLGGDYGRVTRWEMQSDVD